MIANNKILLDGDICRAGLYETYCLITDIFIISNNEWPIDNIPFFDSYGNGPYRPRFKK